MEKVYNVANKYPVIAEYIEEHLKVCENEKITVEKAFYFAAFLFEFLGW